MASTVTNSLNSLDIVALCKAPLQAIGEALSDQQQRLIDNIMKLMVGKSVGKWVVDQQKASVHSERRSLVERNAEAAAEAEAKAEYGASYTNRTSTYEGDSEYEWAAKRKAAWDAKYESEYNSSYNKDTMGYTGEWSISSTFEPMYICMESKNVVSSEVEAASISSSSSASDSKRDQSFLQEFERQFTVTWGAEKEYDDANGNGSWEAKYQADATASYEATYGYSSSYEAIRESASSYARNSKTGMGQEIKIPILTLIPMYCIIIEKFKYTFDITITASESSQRTDGKSTITDASQSNLGLQESDGDSTSVGYNASASSTSDYDVDTSLGYPVIVKNGEAVTDSAGTASGSSGTNLAHNRLKTVASHQTSSNFQQLYGTGSGEASKSAGGFSLHFELEGRTEPATPAFNKLIDFMTGSMMEPHEYYSNPEQNAYYRNSQSKSAPAITLMEATVEE